MTDRRRPWAGITPEASTPGDYALPHPEPGAPNVVLIVLDDTGFAQLGCFGSGIATPHIDRLAANGLRYNRFHVTALCSPTRACLLTGRNPHAVGMGFLTDIPTAYPGYTSRIPKSAATMPRLLRDSGYNTMAVGKWHLVPSGERSHAGPFDRWPLGFGFERYYGFLQGDTNQWTPNLVRDNQYVEAPRAPEDGYHLTEDLAATAIRYVQNQKHAAPDRPFFLYFSLGAMHAPHHVAREWIEPYHGRFDGGWERWREEVFARQIELGVVPEGTLLPERPPWVQDWDALTADERRVYARFQEVFAGFLTHTDEKIGRLVTFLEEIGQLDNTLVMLVSDNGTSAEGGVSGTFNEHRFTLALPDTIEENLARLDELGGFRSYNHYPWGWAWAGNTPLRLWKRYTWLGGIRTPLIVHWPDGFSARGVVRDQFVHAIDLMPTVLDACGVAPPATHDGVTQQPIDGVSIRNTFDDASAPNPRDVQYFEMLGSRSIVYQGWKATTDHVSQGVVDEERLLVGSRDFDTDTWGLFNLDEDFAEATDIAAEHPDVLARLQDVWLVEAARNQVFPLVDNLIGRFGAALPAPNPPASRCVYRPEGSPVPDDSVPRLFGGFRLSAAVEVPDAPEGVLCALGDWTNGFAFYVRDGRLVFALNRAGDLRVVTGSSPVPAGRHELMCHYALDGGSGPAVTLLHDDEVVASVTLDVPVPLFWQHGGTALCLGYDRGFPVCDDYEVPFAWNGVLHEVVVEVGRQMPPDPGVEMRVALAAE
ncbi:MAG: arylsulfatase [Acidimicrobiia bacterium]